MFKKIFGHGSQAPDKGGTINPKSKPIVGNATNGTNKTIDAIQRLGEVCAAAPCVMPLSADVPLTLCTNV